MRQLDNQHPAVYGGSIKRWFLFPLIFFAFSIFSETYAQSDPLKLARLNFDYGRYATSIGIIDSLHSKKLLSENSSLIDAWRIHGLSHFYLGHSKQARASFLKLLSMDPDFELDPLVVPPAAVMEFDDVRNTNSKLLEPIRHRKKAVELEKLHDENQRKTRLEAEERKKVENETMVFIQRVEKHHYLIDFLPFGAPQMEQNRMREGVLLGVGQGIALAATIVTYERTKSFIGADFTVPSDKLEAAKKWRVANWVAFGVSGALYVVGVVDALWHHQEETVTWVPMPSRSPSTSPPPPTRSTPENPFAPTTTSPFDTQFFLAPVQGGAQCGVVGRF